MKQRSIAPCARAVANASVLIALLIAGASSRAEDSGVIVSRHEFQTADLSTARDGDTVGDFLRRSPTGPMRPSDVPTVRMADYTVVTGEGKKLHITQKADNGLAPGVHVLVRDEHGVPRLVAQDANP